MNTHDPMYRAAFIQGYQICALWSSTDTDPKTGEDVELDTFRLDQLGEGVDAAMEADCDKFIAENRNDLQHIEPGQAGHDFWLTRNGHGAGFWDRGLGERGDRLSKACDAFGHIDLYIGDDGFIYQA